MDLDALAQTTPGINEQNAKRQQAARDIMLQRQVGALPTQQAESQASQQLAQGMAQQAGQDALQNQGQQVQQAAKAQEASNINLQNNAQSQLAQRKSIQSQALTDMASLKQDEMANAMLQSRKRVMDQEIKDAAAMQQHGIDQDNSLQMATIQQRKDLMRIGSDVKDKIVDSRLRFEKDELGRKFTNERQLSDYILSNARTQQEFDSELRGLMKDADRYIMTLDTASKKLEQALQQGYIREKGDLDHQQAIDLANKKKELDAQIAKKQRQRRNNASAITAVFTIAGTVAGAVVGAAAVAGTGGAATPLTPQAVMAGASLGSQVGNALGGTVSTNNS